MKYTVLALENYLWQNAVVDIKIVLQLGQIR